MIEHLDILFHRKGKAYRYGTTDYYLLDEGEGCCSLYIEASGSFKKDPKDWLRNFTAIPTRIKINNKTVLVHKGFKEGYDELLLDLLPRLEPFKAVNITGYSHGSGIAQILYAYLKTETSYKVSTPVLFGCPNTFSWLWLPGYLYMRKICYDIVRVRLGNDIVGTLPPVCLGYSSVGTEIRIKPERPKLKFAEYCLSFFSDHGLYWSYFKENRNEE